MRLRSLICALLVACPALVGRAQTATMPFLPVSDVASAGAIPLAGSGQAATIYYDSTDATVVGIAAYALSADVQRVTGLTPAVSTGAPAAAPSAIFVGTVGKSALISGLVAQGKLDVSDLQGQWEAYTAKVVDNPAPGISQGLVIAGSDRRGTAFGVFGLSEAMGVSPWYWWADVPTVTKAAVYVGGGSFTEPSPGVKYRGLFLNDEDWGLQPWAAKTFDPATGDIGPNTYVKFFELLLRLHANYCWPAMHTVTKAFNTFSANKVVADNYAIVMGSSHHEPMLRNTDEYDPAVLGAYNYWTNRNNIYNFWDQRVASNGAYENIYTIGMRGLTDDGIIAPTGSTTQDKVNELQNFIIPDQRLMLANRVNPNPAAVPQIFVPYKEALIQYQAGLQVPDDVILVWPDDNHGYIRELSTSTEAARSGGSGVYYHYSYWGVPYDFLWLCTTPPGLTWEEMSKAWDYNARKLWIANIGDIKPGEIGADFFLRMARHPDAFRNFNQHNYLVEWATRTFGATNAEAISTILDEYYRLNITVRPEHLNITLSGFSFTSNGDEAQQRLNDFAAMVASANGLYTSLPANQRDAFYQLVLYPVRASGLMNQKVLLAERSRLFAVQGRASTAATAAAAQAAYDAIQAETATYNTGISGGKWNWMMSSRPHPTTGDVFGVPTMGSYSAPTAAGLGVAVEGTSSVVASSSPGLLPTFNPVANKRYFIDVFNTGTGAMTWTAQASAPWITLSQGAGNADARVLVGVDWTKAPRGFQVPGTVTIQGASTTRTVNVAAFYPLALDLSTLPSAVENNGTLTIEAENFTSTQDNAGVGWRAVDRAVPSRNGMTVLPSTAASVAPASVTTSSPSLVYRFHTFGTGAVTIRTACLPTHKINSEHPGVRYAISLNGETPQVINVDADENSTAWNANVLRATAYGVSTHAITAPGLQTLRVYMVDAGVVIDKFNIRVGNQAGGEFEAENLTAAATSGQTYRTFTEAPASGGAAVALESVNVGDYCTLVVPNLQAGTYDLAVRVKELNNRGKMRVSVADTLTGTYTDIGSELDLYSAAAVYFEFPAIRFTLATPGSKYLKFRVTGRNAANTAGVSWITLDRLVLNPIAGATNGYTALQNWRQTYFGTVDGTAEAADTADPDGDGIPNLLEYALGSYPTANSSPAWNIALVNNHLAMTFPRQRDATDITYHVLAGSSLLTAASEIWTSATTPYAGGSAASALVTVTDPLGTSESAARFLKLQVTRP